METYNNVVGNTLSLLNSMSLDERARRYKDDQKESEVQNPTIFLLAFMASGAGNSAEGTVCCS